MKPFFSFFILSATLLCSLFLNSCSNDEKYHQSQMKNIASEYESIIQYNEERHWTQVSVSIGHSIIQEIFLGKRNNPTHISLSLDHYFNFLGMVAISTKIKDKDGNNPFIALWQENGRIRKFGAEAVVPESVVRNSLKSSSTVTLGSQENAISLEVTIYYSQDDLKKQLSHIKKQFKIE